MYVESRKNGTDEPICKAEIKTQTYGYQSEDREGGMNWETGIDIYMLLCIK